MSRPTQDVCRLLKDHPELPQFVNEIYEAKSAGRISWPSWCFIPVGIWSQLAELEYELGNPVDLSDLLAALKETPVTGDLPSQVLLRLPEWAVYVETPGFAFYGHPVEGFYGSLDYNLQHDVPELRLMFAVPPASFQTLSIVLDDSPLEETLANLVKYVDLDKDIENVLPGLSPTEKTAAISKRFVAELSPFLSLLLFVCSEEPEIDDLLVPGTSPKYAAPARRSAAGVFSRRNENACGRWAGLWRDTAPAPRGRRLRPRGDRAHGAQPPAARSLARRVDRPPENAGRAKVQTKLAHPHHRESALKPFSQKRSGCSARLQSTTDSSGRRAV